MREGMTPDFVAGLLHSPQNLRVTLRGCTDKKESAFDVQGCQSF